MGNIADFSIKFSDDARKEGSDYFKRRKFDEGSFLSVFVRYMA